MKKNAQGFNISAQDSNPGSRSREFEALPWAIALIELNLTDKYLTFYLLHMISTTWTGVASANCGLTPPTHTHSNHLISAALRRDRRSFKSWAKRRQQQKSRVTIWSGTRFTWLPTSSPRKARPINNCNTRRNPSLSLWGSINWLCLNAANVISRPLFTTSASKCRLRLPCI